MNYNKFNRGDGVREAERFMYGPVSQREKR